MPFPHCCPAEEEGVDVKADELGLQVDNACVETLTTVLMCKDGPEAIEECCHLSRGR